MNFRRVFKLEAILSAVLAKANSERAKSTAWALVGLAGPTGIQLIYMIVAARALGATQAGNLFLVISVATVTLSFVGLGGGGLVMRQTSRDPSSAPLCFGQAQAMTLVTLAVLLPLVAPAAMLVTKGALPLWLIVLVAGSEMLAMRMLTTCWQLFIAKEQQVRAGLTFCSMPFARLCAVSFAWLWPPEHRLQALAVLYCVSSLTAVTGALLYVRSKIGPPKLTLKGYQFRDGASFAMTWLNASLQTESDKLILSFFASPAAVAVYTIASRLMDGAAMPPRALKTSFQSKLFREGAKGHLSTYRFTLKILPLTVAYGLLAWAGFALLAPMFVLVFGPRYGELARILPILGALPLLRAISDFGAEIFLASDRPSIQAATQTVATIARVAIGFSLIAPFKLEGAIATALVVNLMSGIVLWTIAWLLSRGPPEVPTAEQGRPA